MASALAIKNVSAGYGETVVIEGITLSLEPGESVALIGRNGVGKTTLLATIMGHTRLHGGDIAVAGASVVALAPYKRAAAGLGYVPQEREIFPSLTLRENLEVAVRPGRWTVEKVFELFPPIARRERNMGNQLSGGEQQMLAIARALVGNPTVLLMDEPTEGLAPVIVEDLVRAMHALRGDQGLAIVLVEQHTRIALDFSPRSIVMEDGHIVYDGASAALKADPTLLESYIGVAGGARRKANTSS
jgi:branched-chain amino acid transport system ATP-binding protein